MYLLLHCLFLLGISLYSGIGTKFFPKQHEQKVIIGILFSQLKFLYPLKTLVFPAFSPPRFGPFPSFFPLREEMRETFFRPSLQPYPAALRKFAWPLWWRGRKCSSWYLHQNVPAAPAHPWVLPRERRLVVYVCLNRWK